MRTTIEFFLNGDRVSVPASQSTRTVLAWLREEKRLTGTKEGCAEGDCGACSVVLETKDSSLPVCSCIYLLGALDGKALITVDGLKDHPVQRAMVECHGSQCGFCTPGFVMALYAHYRNRNGSLYDALAGNLCRCTGYAPILAAGKKMFDYQESTRVTASLKELPEDSVSDPGFSAPRSLAELATVLRPGVTLLGGGTDLGLVITKQLRELENVVYLGNIAELRTIEESQSHVELGGAVTYAEAHAALARIHPDIGELVRRLGGAQVRACGTIAGNIANGSPIGDSMPFLLALGASLLLHQGGRERVLLLENFYSGYRKTVLQPGELIRSIRVPKLAKGARFAAYKISRRFDQDISAVCAAFHLEGKNARFAFGGMAATPARAPRAEAAFSQGVEKACSALAEDFEPLSDHRASAWYRLKVAQNLLRKFAAGVSSREILQL
ncbi:MAG TPA: xanthine dehydrogenase small subunit [Burkholderiales bacterium]|nr:xanthine dehydrogenase small subunit [Burkholderiales bacterium]